jgi:small subunit ribosomal protein S1
MNPMKPLEQSSDDPILEADSSDFGAILQQFEQESAARKAESTANEAPVQGTVLAVEDGVVTINIGRSTEGVLPLERVSDANGQPLVNPGDQITVTILGTNERGQFLLSSRKMEAPKDWSSFESALAEQRPVEAVVMELIKGGFRVEVNGIRAFMPASRSGVREMNDMPKLVGQKIEARIIKLDTAKEDVVVDRRVLLEEQDKASKEAAFAALAEGQTVTGKVRTLTDYGAFLDIGGVDGLLHVADISWNRVGKPADVLTVGEEVAVKILKINANTRKISLGMKQLVPDPWSVAAEKYQPNTRVNGKVVRLTDFGAFVELEAGIDGMIHVSELSWTKKVRKPSDLLKIDEAVDVVILSVDTSAKRIALGLKQALGDPWEEVEKKFPVGTTLEAPISNLAQFGAFVDLGEGFEGLIHIGDITREKRLNHPKEMLNAGQTVKAQVLEIDKERRRIRLGMKQLEPTSLDIFLQEHNVGDVLTGRVLEVSNTRARFEISDGVVAAMKIEKPTEEADSSGSGSASKVDVASATALLAAKWKSGGLSSASGSTKEKKDQLRPGQVRQVKIANIDAQSRKIEVELAS